MPRCSTRSAVPSIDALKAELARVESLGGEGLMLRQPGSQYEAGRSTTLLKVKTFHDAEGRVVEHLAGKGRHAGRLGAVVVELPDGQTFSVGTGFSDAQRQNPPAVGSTDYLPLPGDDGSWRAAVPVVRAGAGRRGTAESGRAKSYSFQASSTQTKNPVKQP